MPAELEVTLHLLAKAPLAGQAKTRLIPLLGAEGAADAHCRLLKHCLDNACQALPVERITLWTALDHHHALFRQLQREYGIQLRPQPPGDLGERIQAALAAEPGPAMVMGSDCPSISAQLIRHCAAQLAHQEVVILPAEDGGYGLIGTHTETPALFRDIPWGTSEVLSRTREKIAFLNLDVVYPAIIWDVDHPADWQRWQRLSETM
ncbi:TIGR04282 family arsenosugar biosynthesis glycosyltransferase [Vreelandella aquamarina]